MYPLPVAAVTMQHRPGGLKQQKLPQAVEARVQRHGGSSIVLPEAAEDDSSLTLSTSRSLGVPGFVAASLLSLLPLLSPVSVSILTWTSIILD